MNETLFSFRSVTAAMQGSRVLEQAGITSVILRLPKQLRGQGCGYGLKVRGAPAQRAEDELRRAHVEYRKRYQRTSGEQWQEAAT